MKFIFCDECKDIVHMYPKEIKECVCGKYCGKYLDDFITIVVNGKPLIVGIDNNSFKTAIDRAEYTRCNYENYVVYYFTGWVPSKPGEIIFVDNKEDVINFPNDFDTGIKNKYKWKEKEDEKNDILC